MLTAYQPTLNMQKNLRSMASAAALLGALSAPAFAASTFHLVVPLSRATAPQTPEDLIVVSLAGAALPKATVNTAYSQSLQDYLAVTGDKALDKAAARWSLAEGSLPAGLALDATTGAVSGTPTAKTTTPASFKVLATYKDQGGQASYTIEVGGVVFQVKKLSVGEAFTCAITNSNGVKCWGRNANGQLGDGTTTQRLAPVQVVGLEAGVIALDAGAHHVCAVTQLGAVKCWGTNSNGELGNNSTTQANTPVQVSGLTTNMASVTAGTAHTCATNKSGGVYCWGYGGQGQLGVGTSDRHITPVAVPSLVAGVTSMALGHNHTCAVQYGAAKCWGHGYYGQLGDTQTFNRNTPVAVTGLTSGVRSISASGDFTCAVTTSGAAKCWGRNSSGQLGDNSTTQRNAPVNAVGLSTGVDSVSAGWSHSCALKTDASIMCWGAESSGRLGTNGTDKSLVPVAIQSLANSISVSAGGAHSCAIASDGTAKCWGAGNQGQLGDSTAVTSQPIPVDVSGS